MQAHDDHRTFVRLRARSGFWTALELDELIDDIVTDELDDDDDARAELKAIASRELAGLEVAELGWTSATVNDRISAAFEDLDAHGIVAMQNCGYTMTDGWSEVNEIALERAEAGDSPRGATFYHEQDLERGVAGHGLSLIFSAFVKGPELVRASLVVAREIVATLERYGVGISWDGTVESRIMIVPFEWMQRLRTSAPVIVPMLVQPMPDRDLLN